jgi:phosphohistidine swiveling domain-containing protein
MLTPDQQQELINTAKIFEPMHLWSGSLDEFTPVPTPSTFSFVLDKINNQHVLESAMKMTTMPLSLPNEPYIVNVLDHAYVNMNFEKQLYLDGASVSFDSVNPHDRPEINMIWSGAGILTNAFILARQFGWILGFILTQKHKNIGQKIWNATVQTAANITTLNDISEIEKDIEHLISCVLAIELIYSLLEQYVKEDIKPKYLYSWDIIEAFYWQRFRPLDMYYQSTYSVGAVNAGIISKEQYLKDYGTRGFVDFELMSPRYSEVPDNVFNSPYTSKAQIMEEKLVNIAAIHNIRSLDRKLLEAAWEIKALRGSIRMTSLTGIAKLRAALLNISKGKTLSNDLIFFMTKEEIHKDPAAFMDAAAERQERYNANMKLQLPTLLTRDVVVKMTAIHEKGEKAIGTGVSAGEVQGTLLFVKTPETDAKTLENHIVVFPDASPEFSMLYRHAKGIIFQSGGAMSHGAIVAREYRIPAITLGGHELTWEPNTSVQLNGTEGKVQIL